MSINDTFAVLQEIEQRDREFPDAYGPESKAKIARMRVAMRDVLRSVLRDLEIPLGGFRRVDDGRA